MGFALQDKNRSLQTAAFALALEGACSFILLVSWNPILIKELRGCEK